MNRRRPFQQEHPLGCHGPGRLSRAAFVAWFVGAAAGCLYAQVPQTQTSTLYLGFSSAMFTQVNENDARAAVKVWGQTFAKERKVAVEPEAQILKDAPAQLEAIQRRKVDALAITIVEYCQLREKVPLGPVFVCYKGGKPTDRYLLLTRTDAPINSIADLRGRSLTIHQSPHTCLAATWLDDLLAGAVREAPHDLLSKIVSEPKLSKVVLPVFFGQTDSCLVSKAGFDTMSELNPQIGKRLRVLAASPDWINAVLVLREDYNPRFKSDLIKGLNELHTSPAGQQVLSIFQTERLEEKPVSFLETTVQFVAGQEQLRAARGAALVGHSDAPAEPRTISP